MSDLSSNSMSRDELIRNARANCMRQIDNPYSYGDAEQAIAKEPADHTRWKRGTYIRLFVSCFILLGLLAVKQFGLTYKNYSFATVVTLVEDNSGFEKLQKQASKTLEEDVIPTIKQIKNSYFLAK